MAAAAPGTPPLPDRRGIYFVNGWVDVALVGGLSVLAGLILWGLDARGHPDPVPGLAFFLGWLVNWPHFSASSYRLYHSKSNIAQYPVTALGIPFLMLAVVIGAFSSPLTVAPTLVKLFLLWSPFHFMGQSVGITLLYARRSGFPVGRLDRAVYSGFFYASYLSVVVSKEVDPSLGVFGGVLYPRLGLPGWMATATQIAVILYGALFLLQLGRTALGARRPIPPILLLPAVTQLLWFEIGRRVPSYDQMVPFFHALQYLLIAWAMQLKERLAASGAVGSKSFVLWESSKWYLLNLVGGALLFGLIPRAATRLGFALEFTQPVLFAAIQIHHFFVDGVIWKLRNPNVGNPLLFRLEEAWKTEEPARGAA
jgi:hypothetical protein